MTRHSTLTNPNDLHYAKLRTFTGSPSLITPDFVDQLLSATDTNKTYRATSLTEGGMVELSVQSDNEEGNGGSLTTVGIGDPQDTPTAIGQNYFDSASQTEWISVNASMNGWIEKGFQTNLTISLNNQSSQSLSNYFSIFYADTDPATIESGDFTFTQLLGYLQYGEAKSLVFPAGRGCFAFVPSSLDLQTTAINLESPYTGSNAYSKFQVRTSPYNLFVDDQSDFFAQPIGRGYLNIPSYAHNLNQGLSLPRLIKFQVGINVLDI